MRIIGILAAALVLLAGEAGSAVIVNFDGLLENGPGARQVSSPYPELGFTFTALGAGFESWRTGAPGYAGSPALQNRVPDDTTVLTADGGAVFGLLSIDLSEVFAGSGQSVSVTFTGTKFDTSTVIDTFVLDGTHGFENFSFTGFTDLVSVSWIQTVDYHQFDNVVLLIPEPATAALLILGLVGLAAGRRR